MNRRRPITEIAAVLLLILVLSPALWLLQM
jgi:hypothetical protein